MNNLITTYKRIFNLEHAHFFSVDHDDAMVAIVYRVEQPNGEQLILKISERINDYFREIYFLKYLSNKLPVPQIINVAHSENNNSGAILMECLPGDLIKTLDFTEKLSYEIGSVLANIHLNRTAGYGDLIQQNTLSSDPRVDFTFKFEESLAECNGHLPNRMITKCHEYFDANLNLLTTVDGPCIVHRDFRPGNMIIDSGKLQGVIDWASARASFAEEDFCSIESGEWGIDHHNKKFFLEGYASVRSLPNYTAVIPLLRLSKAIATIGFTVKRAIGESSGARIYQTNRNFLEKFINELIH